MPQTRKPVDNLTNRMIHKNSFPPALRISKTRKPDIELYPKCDSPDLYWGNFSKLQPEHRLSRGVLRSSSVTPGDSQIVPSFKKKKKKQSTLFPTFTETPSTRFQTHPEHTCTKKKKKHSSFFRTFTDKPPMRLLIDRGPSWHDNHNNHATSIKVEIIMAQF